MSSVGGSDGVVGEECEEREEANMGLESSALEEAIQYDGESPHQSNTV